MRRHTRDILTFLVCSVYFWVSGNLHIKNLHIIYGKHAQELYANFYMPPKASQIAVRLVFLLDERLWA